MIINGKDISSLKNIATGTDSLTIDGVATSSKKAVNIGKQSSATADYTVAIGNALASKKYATAVGGALEGYTTIASGQNSTAIGGGANASGQNSTAIGDRSVSASHLTIAIGSEANAQNGICVGSKSSSNGSCSVSLGTLAVTNAAYAIQIGRGSNTTANTLNVGLNENNNYTLLESDGTIPNARLKNTVLINTATGTNSITVGGMATSNNNAINIGKSSISTTDGVAIGYSAQVNSANGTAIGSGSNVNAIKSTAIGYGAVTTAQHAIQLGYGTNATADTLSVGFYDETTPVNSKNYTLLNASGIIPIARLGATSGDDNKFLKGDGTWAEVQSGGSLPSQTGHAGEFLTTNGTDASWNKILLTDLVIGNERVKVDYPGHNFTTVGDVNIQNNIASGFANKTKYLYSSEPLPYTQQFELQIKLNIGTLDTKRNQWFCANESSTKKAVTWGIVGNTRTQRLYVTTDGSAWVNPANGTFQFQDNTDYVLKLVYDGSSYTSYYSTDDGETWIADAVISRSEPLPADRPIYLGVSEEQTNCWPGSIDLSRTFMKVNGEIVWQPFRSDKSSITLNLPANLLYDNRKTTSSLCIRGSENGNGGSTAIGQSSSAFTAATAIGANAYATNNSCIAIGSYSLANGYGSIAIGGTYSVGSFRTQSGGSWSIAIGDGAKTTAIGTIQLGRGTSSDNGCFYVSLTTDGTNWTNYKLLDADGKIPVARLPFQKICENNTVLTSDGTNCEWVITHNLGTKDVMVSVYDLITDVEPLYNVEHTSTNTITIIFNSATDIPADSYRAVIIG